MAKNTIFLWYDKDAEAAARFYAETFPNSAVGVAHRAPSDYPSGKEGDVLTVEFTVAGVPCIGLNGGPAFKHNEAFSFQIATDDQQETDRYWNTIVGNGGQESQCSWCKDKFGLSWQIVPRALINAISDPDKAAAKRAMDAMMGMKKIDIAAIERARNETPFDFRMLDPDHPENGAELARRWPIARFPLLVDGGTTVFETSAIIEHLMAFHGGPVPLIPADAKAAVPVRMLDRVFDNHVMGPMQAIV